MNVRFRGLGSCVAVLMLAQFSAALAADTKPSWPNIVFILADDYGIPGVGCYGGNHKTPNLDALAKGGTRFENCFAAPLCGPTRALLMTGRYAFRTGMLTNGTGAAVSPDREVCIARVLKEAGYATAVAGKWRQLQYFQTQADAQKWGFDEFMTWGARGVSDEAAAEADDDTPKKKKQNKQAKKEAKEKGERYWEPDYNLNGKPLADVEGKYGPDLLHNFVVDFIERHREGPFFVYYPTPLIHGPILRTPDSQPDGKKNHYEDNIAYLDKLVGKLVAELDRLKLRDNTLIVFTGDNGSTETGTINGRKVDGRKSNLLEGGSRVPLIVNWPGVTPAGAVRKDLVDFSDLFPTFAEVAGAKLPNGVKIDGHSFAAAIKGEIGQPRDWVYVQLGEKRYVRDATWKLNNDGEFFDMRDAPFNQFLLTKPTGYAKAAREELQKVLDGLISEDKAAETPAKKKKKKATQASATEETRIQHGEKRLATAE